MGSNPQILYTPQQQMGYGGFSVPCRVGNWAEDEYLGVLLTSQHIAQSGESMLVSQKLGNTLGAALAPAELERERGYEPLVPCLHTRATSDDRYEAGRAPRKDVEKD